MINVEHSFFKSLMIYFVCNTSKCTANVYVNSRLKTRRSILGSVFTMNYAEIAEITLKIESSVQT